MARAKKGAAEPKVSDSQTGDPDRLDVNAVVSYNVRSIRERRGWTQQAVAERLGLLTKHVLPQASISAMERGFDGDRRRRFDAHELYLLSVVFSVPIAYFFLPPPGRGYEELADTRRPVAELYVSLLGRENQLEDVDSRLADINLTNPETVDGVLAALFGADKAARNWHGHFRNWRKTRLAELAKNYGDQLDEVADFLADFALKVKTMGPQGYLQSTAHLTGEEVLDHLLMNEED